MIKKELYTEDEVVELRNHLDNLKGKILLDNYNELYTLVDYDIESVTSTKGFFKKKEQTEFYIKYILLSSGGIDIKRDDNRMCSFDGITNLLEFNKRWLKLQRNLVLFSSGTGIPLNFNILK